MIDALNQCYYIDARIFLLWKLMDIPVAENFAEVTSQNVNEETDSIPTQDVLHPDLCKIRPT